MDISIIYYSETGNTAKMAQLIAQGCESVAGAKVKAMSVEKADMAFLQGSSAVIFGSPTHGANLSWQMKRFLEELDRDLLAGKLGAVFASQNWPGGGGASFAEMSIISSLLVRGMLIYSGGLSVGEPPLHFGAVSHRAPDDELSISRCIKLGQNIANKATELFGNN
jgi:NAD(P)H dehydrogenase (quinone)